ncbi:MAG: hypothetical protein AAF629_30445 [Chloroflexota bacterium]
MIIQHRAHAHDAVWQAGLRMVPRQRQQGNPCIQRQSLITISMLLPLGHYHIDVYCNPHLGLAVNTSEAWQIRPRGEEGESVGHEYWHTNSIHVSYHGCKVNNTKFFGQWESL